MPSTRYTVRLPPALDTALQEYLRTAGTSFAVLIRQTLAPRCRHARRQVSRQPC
jgi:hypothetical protein